MSGRPYKLVQVADGYALRTKAQSTDAVSAAHPSRLPKAASPN